MGTITLEEYRRQAAKAEHPITWKPQHHRNETTQHLRFSVNVMQRT